MRNTLSLILSAILMAVLLTATVNAVGASAEAFRGSVEIDGEIDESWSVAKSIEINSCKAGTDTGTSLSAKLLWDSDYLYALYTVKDANINSEEEFNYNFDSVELYIDEDNSKAEYDKKNDSQIRIMAVEGLRKITTCTIGDIDVDVTAFCKLTSDGYIIEAAYKFKELEPKGGEIIGVDFQCNDDSNGDGERDACYGWGDTEDKGWQTTEVFGSVTLNPTTTESLNVNSSPQTGDNSILILLGICMLLALGVFAIVKKII